MIPLRWRLTFWYVGLTAVILLSFDIVSFWVFTNSLQKEIDNTLIERANHVTDALLVIPNRPIEGVAPEATDEFRSPGIYVQILNNENAVVARSFNLGSQQLPLSTDGQSFAFLDETFSTIQINEQPVRLYQRQLQRGSTKSGVIQVGQSLKGMESTLHRLQTIYAVGTAVILILGATGSWWVSRRGLQPVVNVTQTAHEIAQAEDLTRRVVYSGPKDEIGMLTTTFNQMLARLQTLFESQQRFLAEAAHELRTPLASMLGNVDLLTHADEESALKQESLAAIRRTGRHVARLLDDLLLLAQAEAGWHLQLRPVAVDDVLLETFEAMLPTSGRARLHLRQCDPACILGDPDRLRQVFINVIDNALKHSPDSDVLLELRSNSGRVCINIIDTGPGMTPETLSRVYEPFFHIPGQVRRASSGLGMTIVRWIVHEHNGTIHIESTLEKGTAVTIHFPEYQNAT